ncbi:MAG TPA: LrgB family protein, partial [Trinickia sp.]|nr:LrgB family protein [Trinickia sp.]
MSISSVLSGSLAAARPQFVAAACFVLTIVFYAVGKRLYARFRRPWLTPLVIVPAMLAAVVLAMHIPYSVYFADTRWLMWLLGPATVAFAVPIYEYRDLMRRHWISLAAGVTVGIVV